MSIPSIPQSNSPPQIAVPNKDNVGVREAAEKIMADWNKDKKARGERLQAVKDSIAKLKTTNVLNRVVPKDLLSKCYISSLIAALGTLGLHNIKSKSVQSELVNMAEQAGIRFSDMEVTHLTDMVDRKNISFLDNCSLIAKTGSGLFEVQKL